MELAATKTGMSIAKPARQRETSPGAGVRPRQEHGRVTPPQGGRPVSNKRATRPTRRVGPTVGGQRRKVPTALLRGEAGALWVWTRPLAR